jgi:hypothetical protein
MSDGLLRPTQRRWFKSRIRAHGRVVTCVRIGLYVHLIGAHESLLVTRETSYEDFKKLCFKIIPMKALSVGDNDGILRRTLCEVSQSR